MSITSSIQRKHPGVVSSPMLMLHLGFFPISFMISSITLSYSRTDSIPPWRMLSFMCICLVCPCWIFTDAVRLSFSFFVMLHSLPFTPLLSSAYMIALFHALLYALVTSRNTSIGFCFFSLLALMKLIIRKRWSAVDFPLILPPWFGVMFMTSLILLFIILSNSFPELLLRVIPLSLLHFPFFPFPL